MRFPAYLSVCTQMIAGVICALAIGQAAVAADARDAIQARDTRDAAIAVTSFKPVSYGPEQAAAKTTRWQASVTPPTKPEPRYAVLLFEGVEAKADGDYAIELQDNDGRVLAAFPAAFLAENPSFTSPQLKPKQIDIVVTAPSGAPGLRFTVKTMLVSTSKATTKSQSIGPNIEWVEDLAATDPAMAWARGVVKLTIHGNHACTGFLVAADKIATAHHCLDNSVSYVGSQGKSARTCSDVAISFDYIRDPYGAVRNPLCLSVKADPAKADVAVLTLSEPAPPVAGGGGRILKLASADPAAGGVVNVLGHPYGFPMGASLSCSVKSLVAPGRLEHNCDTVGGNSGGPILNANGEVVGVHTDGFIDDELSMQAAVVAYRNACRTTGCPYNSGVRVSQLKALLN
ncbi:trypsin-like serine peptidase [Caulobacter soli]|uniref:trypsin-like serine peptidase n=1 Tax=Caulobacter soli TaxID=2708539 RepID=UPI0013EC8C1E|nr:serine protease [Caulobacter soli]